MKRNILVLTEGYIYERRGYFNAVVSRTKHLKAVCDYNIDVLLLTTYEPWIVRKLRHTPKREKPKIFQVDGVMMRVDWRRFSLLDYILNVKLHWGDLFTQIHNERLLKKLKGYDLIIAHSINCGRLARRVKQLYGIPYTVTWHGSDIHSGPFNNPSILQPTIDVIEDADMNFFVSKALMDTSEKITKKGIKMVLYNGYNQTFKRYSEAERFTLRQKYNVINKKVVVFAGSFFLVKNILIIPHIFKAIYKKNQDVEFWMIGDGKFRTKVEELSAGLPIRFWGNQEPESMPDFLNAADVLILPSKNEGLPLIVVEGLVCGCNVVASLVGGIPEVIGKENCVDLSDSDFIEKFADKVLFYLLANPRIEQKLDPEFNWNRIAQIENKVIKNILFR